MLSDEIKVKITSNPGETFLDRMISLVEGASRQKTPNEIALNILLAGLTIIFLLAVVTLQPFAIYSGAPQSIFVLVSLLVCLIPTTIGGLLSAIGIAGLGNVPERDEQNKGGEGNIKEENPMPGSVLDQPSSENGAEGSSNGCKSCPGPDRFTARFFVKG